MKIERYKKYKDSEIEWLGDIPEHWKTNFLIKALSSVIDYRGRTPKKVEAEENGMFLVTARNIKRGYIDYSLSEEFVDIDDAQSLLARGKPKIGDVLFTTEAPLGEVANVDREDFALAQRIIKFRGKKRTLDNYFMKYWLMSSGFQYSLYCNATGSTALGLKGSKVRLLSIILPPLTEQATIATYLDEKTAQLDRQIDLLSQKAVQYGKLKRSLIKEAVTLGLDKTLPMKDSEVEWISEVPAHWKIQRIADVAVQNKAKNESLVEKNLLSLSYGRIIQKDFNTSFGLLPGSFETYQIVKPGTVILRLTDLQNDQRSLRVGLVREQGIITSAYLGLCFRRAVNPDFAYYLLHVYDLCKVFYWFGGGLRSTMRFDDIRIIPFIVPPLEEQLLIVAYLNEKTTEIDRIITIINTQIENLKELRKTLINDVVTGKIKVVKEEQSA